MTTKYLHYPASGMANLLAEIEDRVELLHLIVTEYEGPRRARSTRSIMAKIVRSYGYTYEEYQYGVFMS